jgi:regulator of replication initiation timing
MAGEVEKGDCAMDELAIMPKVKDCPFCHCDDIVLENIHGEYIWVCQNDDCIATGPYDECEDRATEKWNTRPLEDDLMAEIERLEKQAVHHSMDMAAKQINAENLAEENGNLRREIERLRAARDAEVLQFNDGYRAYENGETTNCSPPYDNDTHQWRIGWAWAQYNALKKREAANE